MTKISHPFQEPPAFGEIAEIQRGIGWLRLPLPYRLDHVNVYLIEDGDGWTVIDAGIFDKPTIAIWEALLAGPLPAAKLKRLVVTHHHPDHIGMAGWLCERAGIPLLTSQTAYLFCDNISLDPGALQNEQYRNFYLSHGMPEAIADQVGTQGHDYLTKVSRLPLTFLRLMAGDTLVIGERRFKILSGDGHAPEQIMMYCAEDNILVTADQVIARITPNVSVWAAEPDGDPLGHFMRSIRFLKQAIPHDTLILPGHQLPFVGLHQRCDEMLAHHEERCRLVSETCRTTPQTIMELVPVLFQRPLDAHQLSFAFAETLAHVNRMIRRTELCKLVTPPGVIRYGVSVQRDDAT